MKFAFSDFSQDGTFRVFSFLRLPLSEEHGKYQVKADMNLARRYGISLQELPLLCLTALEARSDIADERSITYTADEMMVLAAKRSAAVRTRKPFPPRRQPQA